MKEWNFFSNMQINTIGNYVPRKKGKFKYDEASWICKNIKSTLRKKFYFLQKDTMLMVKVIIMCY